MLTLKVVGEVSSFTLELPTGTPTDHANISRTGLVLLSFCDGVENASDEEGSPKGHHNLEKRNVFRNISKDIVILSVFRNKSYTWKFHHLVLQLQKHITYGVRVALLHHQKRTE